MCLSPLDLSFLITASCWNYLRNWKRKESLSKPPSHPVHLVLPPSTSSNTLPSLQQGGVRQKASQPARKEHGLTGMQVSTHRLPVADTIAKTQSRLPPKTWYTSGAEHTFKIYARTFTSKNSLSNAHKHKVMLPLTVINHEKDFKHQVIS